MKRVLIVMLIILIYSVSLSGAGNNFMITISGNYISNADSDFKERYGKRDFFPEGKISIRLKGNLYLWGSLGFFSSDYNWEEWSYKGSAEPDLEGENILDKLVISGGIGYYIGYIEKNEMSIKVEAGICRITHDIVSTLNQIDTNTITSSEETKESGIGIRGNLGVTYGLYKNLFSEVSIGYLYATDKIKVGDENQRIYLGGLRASVGLGLTF
jgi:hypothetical protein